MIPEAQGLLQTLIAVGTIYMTARGIVFLWRKKKAGDPQATIASQSETIETKEKLADAFRERVDQLEADRDRQEKLISSQQREISKLRGKLEAVERYAAPEAIKRFEKQQEVMIEILRSIQQEISTRD